MKPGVQSMLINTIDPDIVLIEQSNLSSALKLFTSSIVYGNI